jgi:murein DD-endopeptidase MepM/ murein hydrolase activator NlpD
MRLGGFALRTIVAVALTCVGPASLAASERVESPRTSVKVEPGQTLSGIVRAQGFPAAEVSRLLASGADARWLERLRPGQRLEFVRGSDGGLAELRLQPSIETAYRFVRVGDSYESRRETRTFERSTAVARGTIDSSLYRAARRTGLSNQVVLALASVFAWDVDLALELRPGDSFTVVYEQLFLDGRKVRDGDILAAELVSRGRALRLVRYRDPSGRAAYYTPQGASVQKPFLRAPIEFARVTSGFSFSRRHPVLHTMRAHRGVDYAAETGTPIRATGDGKVALAGRHGGFGRTVILNHGGQRSTLYAHMSRLAAGMRAGARVQQGQTIGYVGRSGLATGPHLHYEFRVRGVHEDPLTVDLPKGLPVPDEYREHFLAETQPLALQLAQSGSIQLAAAD